MVETIKSIVSKKCLDPPFALFVFSTVGVPILYILNGKSPNALYLCFALLVSTITITSMSFLIVPKMYNLWEQRVLGDGVQRRTVRISGFGGGGDRRMSIGAAYTGPGSNPEAQLKGLDEKIRLLEIQREQLRCSLSPTSNDDGGGGSEGREEGPVQSSKTMSISDGGSNNLSSSSLQAGDVVHDARNLEELA